MNFFHLLINCTKYSAIICRSCMNFMQIIIEKPNCKLWEKPNKIMTWAASVILEQKSAHCRTNIQSKMWPAKQKLLLEINSSTKLSRYIWDYKRNNVKESQIEWSILKRVYTPVMRVSLTIGCDWKKILSFPDLKKKKLVMRSSELRVIFLIVDIFVVWRCYIYIYIYIINRCVYILKGFNRIKILKWIILWDLQLCWVKYIKKKKQKNSI